MSKELCTCGVEAKWFYLPSSESMDKPFFCDDCVPRGCSCNEYSTIDGDYHPPGGIRPDDEDGIEGVDWVWVNEEKTLWCRIDEKGRKYPCVEFDFDEDGFDFDEN